jgi:hypothetical protein
MRARIHRRTVRISGTCSLQFPAFGTRADLNLAASLGTTAGSPDTTTLYCKAAHGFSRRATSGHPRKQFYSVASAFESPASVEIEFCMIDEMVRAHRPHSALQPRRL